MSRCYKKITVKKRIGKSGGPIYTVKGVNVTLDDMYNLFMDSDFEGDSVMFLGMLKTAEKCTDTKLMNRIIRGGGFVNYVNYLGGDDHKTKSVEIA